MTELCLHCGWEIVPTKPLSIWMTPWRHVRSGYNVCDPGNEADDRRATPNPQTSFRFDVV